MIRFAWHFASASIVVIDEEKKTAFGVSTPVLRAAGWVLEPSACAAALPGVLQPGEQPPEPVLMGGDLKTALRAAALARKGEEAIRRGIIRN
jgi:hypothetical protein